MSDRVVVVTGGGGGIGAAIAEALGRTGWFVVTVDPLVTVDGTQRLQAPEETTAGRIVAAGGEARASSVSVTDEDALHTLMTELVDEFGSLDAVINVAGITRPTGFAKGTEDDWHALLDVHLGGYLNVLDAALPHMVAAGRGRVVGVTSGSGWRPTDAGAYSCAKRAVAALTWQLGAALPPGVTVNALSPIAFTRMVEAALGRARSSAGGPRSGPSAGGGLSLANMPAPEDLAPFGAHLVSDDFEWCRGKVLFAGGSEVALIDEPQLLEVVSAETPAPLAQVLDAVVPTAWAAAEASQASGGGSNPRFGTVFTQPATDGVASGEVRSCLVVGDAGLTTTVTASLEARGITCHPVEAGGNGPGFAEATDMLAATAGVAGPIDAVVVAHAGRPPATGPASAWEQILAEHRGIVDDLRRDAVWVRAVADYARSTDHAVRIVTLTDATTSGGRSRAQASGQLARVGLGATGDRVAAFAVSVEGKDRVPVGELVAHLLCHPDATALAGAPLVAGPGWLGIRSHPRPIGSVAYGGPAVPTWLNQALREVAGER
jgi:NAD(P)-dependent dehydrogenase (short-subunit alcohol dehydrogenase family)